MTAAALLLGAGADLVLGDPARGHPVAGFGSLVLRAERRWYEPTRLRGALLTAGAVGATTALVAASDRALRGHPALRTVAGSAVVWSTLGGASLWRVGSELAGLLELGDIQAARELLPSLAGRDPSALSGSDLARAGTESVAENTSDAIIGALLYGALLGPAGAAGFRAANTLDAMVGHHSARYENYGWASAKLDDALGFLPARLGAWLAVIAAPVVVDPSQPDPDRAPGLPDDQAGNPANAAAVLRRDGHAHPSPNAGQMEAAFAGALGVQLGGPLHYGPRLEERPTLGDGREPDARALRDAVRLSRAVTALTLAVSVGLRLGITLSRGRGAKSSDANSSGAARGGGAGSASRLLGEDPQADSRNISPRAGRA
jgi:adenosylcobinamide-phosphate synthase